MQDTSYTVGSLMLLAIYAFYSRSRKATFSFVMYVRPFVPTELGSHWAPFIKFHVIYFY
jgi:hypothetical protein